jgi:tRNA-specific 2-thiouridylase
VALDAEQNAVTVGEAEDLLVDTVEVGGATFIPFERLPGPRRALASTRHRQPPRPAILLPGEAGTVIVRFEEPVQAVSPGQVAAFYEAEDPDLVVGGGLIRRAWLGRSPHAEGAG